MEFAFNYFQGAFSVQVLIKILSLYSINCAPVWTGQWVTLTHRPVPVYDVSMNGGIVLTVVAAEGSLGANLSLMMASLSTLEPTPAAMNTLHFYIFTSIKLVLWSWVLIQMFLQLSQLPSPLASQITARTVHLQLIKRPLETSVG